MIPRTRAGQALRSKREGGRVVREYMGTGAMGEFWAAVDALKRRERELDRLNATVELEHDASLERLLIAHHRFSDGDGLDVWNRLGIDLRYMPGSPQTGLARPGLLGHASPAGAACRIRS